MEQSFTISGMTCDACVASVMKRLEQQDQVIAAEVQLASPQATIQLKDAVAITDLQKVIGSYQISEWEGIATEVKEEIATQPPKSWQTYFPLLLIVGFIASFSALAQYPFTQFSWMLWMRFFMAGFFIVFAFFKLLNIRGFADSYQMYDLVAARWYQWGYIYPFVELGLGVAYFINIAPVITNWVTLLVLGVSSLGVIKSNLDKRQIKCACLGDVFNLPMSTVTIVEDLTMVAMAAGMLLTL